MRSPDRRPGPQRPVRLLMPGGPERAPRTTSARPPLRRLATGHRRHDTSAPGCEVLSLPKPRQCSVAEELHVRVVLENSSTPKTPSILRGCCAIPLHADLQSRRNLVKRFCRDRVASIRTWTASWNDDPSGTRTPSRSSTPSPPTASGSTTQVTLVIHDEGDNKGAVEVRAPTV